MLQGGSCGQPPQRPPLWDLQPLENGCFGQQWGPGSSLATAADSHPLPALSSSRASSSHSPCQQTWFNEKTNSHPQSAPRPAVPHTASPVVPSPGLHAGSPAKKGLIHPLRWKLAFSLGDCVTVLWWNRLQSSRSFGKRKTDKGPRLEPVWPSARHNCSLQKNFSDRGHRPQHHVSWALDFKDLHCDWKIKETVLGRWPCIPVFTPLAQCLTRSRC